MQCPNCFADIKFRERRSNQCLKCNGTFVFEPKTHPLGLTDAYFSKTVDKLSDGGKIFFTPEQFHFALSRKAIRQSGALGLFIVLAVLTFVPAIYNNWIAGVFVGSFWLIVLIYKIFYSPKVAVFPQPLSAFDDLVLQPWKNKHKNLPPRLITKNVEDKNLKDKLRGFLLCDSQSTANFLIANNLEKNLNLSVSNSVDFPKNKNRRNLPIFVLHDAGFNGYKFLEQIEQIYETGIFDIGLRPNDVKRFDLTVFRSNAAGEINMPELTNEENKWLNKGLFVPLFVMKPAHLIEFVTDKIERRFIKHENI